MLDTQILPGQALPAIISENYVTSSRSGGTFCTLNSVECRFVYVLPCTCIHVGAFEKSDRSASEAQVYLAPPSDPIF